MTKPQTGLRPKDLSVAVVQMTSTSNVSENLNFILQVVASTPAQCIFLPENSLYFNTASTPIPQSVGFSSESTEVKALSRACEQYGKVLHLGGIPWLVDGQIFNGALVVRRDGTLETPYLKTHLFDLELENLRVMESDSYRAGKSLLTFEVDGWIFATAICYDVRFAELFSFYRAQLGVDVFVVPSAFTAKTGEAHWETLLRARAIESQCYVLAPAQVGGHWSKDKSVQRKTWGQSLAIDPWGRTLGEDINHTEYRKFNKSSKGPIEIELAYDPLQAVRTAMPMEAHRAFALDLEPRCPTESV